MTEPQICLLCLKKEPLQNGHVIPKFAYLWHNKSGQGPLRNLALPNKRIQDGYKKLLMCRNCENVFSRWENLFCEKMFKPHQNNTDQSVFYYQDWLLKFAVSLAWRVLNFINPNLELFQKEIRNASITWRDFLLNKSSHPSGFEQHLILLDLSENLTMLTQHPFLNRYLLSSCDFDVVPIDKYTVFVYTKIFKFIFIGIITVKNRAHWKINKIRHNGQNSMVFLF